MYIVFRVDSSREIGIGHLMRCLTLAEAFRRKGALCRFLSRACEGNHSKLVLERGFELFTMPAPEGIPKIRGPYSDWLGVDWEVDAKQTAAFLEPKPIADWLIVDHYALDARWESAMRPYCKRLFVIDDLANREHDCELLLDPGVDPGLLAKYATLTPKHCVRLVGPNYSLLRPEFIAAKKIAKSRSLNAPRRLVLMFGGDDSGHHTIEALEVIQEVSVEGIGADVIVSPASVDKDVVQAYCSSRPGFACHIATDRVAEIFAKADLAIGSGGSATYERLFLRLPSLLKVIAENQREPLGHMASMGLIDVYSSKKELVQKLTAAVVRGVELPPDVVGNGVPAVCDVIFDRAITLRTPSPLDVRRTFCWLRNDGLRRQFLMKDKPHRAGHFAYWRRMLSGKEQRAFSVYEGNAHVGNAGLKNIDLGKGQVELWLYVGDAARRGRGIGSRILERLEAYIVDELCCDKAVLHVSEENVAALGLYRKSGYRVLNENCDAAPAFPRSASILRMGKSL